MEFIYTIIFTFFIIIINLIISIHSESFICGHRYGIYSRRSKRDANISEQIVGGRYASPGDFPWQVSLTLNNQQYCGASIISKMWALTAAHCLNIPGKKAINAGGQYWYGGRKYLVAKAIIHPEFNNQHLSHDIGLLKLKTPILYSRGNKHGRGAVAPICLPNVGDEFNGAAVVSGWGATKEKGFRSNILKSLNVRLLSNQACKKYPFFDEKTQICAGFESGGKDSCQGDSGGPLVKIENQIATLIGVVSNGKGCAREGFPGIYTKVSAFRKWIQHKTGL